jgi:uncharacterized Zn-finger protein
VDPIEIITADEPVVACDGGPMGHPRVFLELGEKGEIDCPYCGRRFVLKPKASEAAGR